VKLQTNIGKITHKILIIGTSEVPPARKISDILGNQSNQSNHSGIFFFLLTIRSITTLMTSIDELSEWLFKALDQLLAQACH
jgi:hypothetical protein